jgi:hypothetical protein
MTTAPDVPAETNPKAALALRIIESVPPLRMVGRSQGKVLICRLSFYRSSAYRVTSVTRDARDAGEIAARQERQVISTAKAIFQDQEIAIVEGDLTSTSFGSGFGRSAEVSTRLSRPKAGNSHRCIMISALTESLCHAAGCCVRDPVERPVKVQSVREIRCRCARCAIPEIAGEGRIKPCNVGARPFEGAGTKVIFRRNVQRSHGGNLAAPADQLSPPPLAD